MTTWQYAVIVAALLVAAAGGANGFAYDVWRHRSNLIAFVLACLTCVGLVVLLAVVPTQ